MLEPRLEIIDGIVSLNPGPWDVHAHPRVFDPLVPYSPDLDQIYEGKAGLQAYSAVALESGIVGMSAMPNESFRRWHPETENFELIQWPVSNYDRAMAMETAIATQSEIMTAYHIGLDPKELYGEELDQSLGWTVLDYHFRTAGDRATALKIFGAESTGNNMVRVDDIPEIARRFNTLYPNKPIIMHLEDDNVGRVLEELYDMDGGADIPVHIAHVSSRIELEAIIAAKEAGMNVTCEVTPHHLFVSALEGGRIGGNGCMKPTLKSPDDVRFLWDNLHYIDIFASDCAPHQEADKAAMVPGVTNHTAMIALYIGAIDEGRMTWDDLFNKMVINPRKRFNLPLDDGSSVKIDTVHSWQTVQEIEAEINPEYGQNIFPYLEKIGKHYHLLGRVIMASSGGSLFVKSRKNPQDVQRDSTAAHMHLVAGK